GISNAYLICHHNLVRINTHFTMSQDSAFVNSVLQAYSDIVKNLSTLRPEPPKPIVKLSYEEIAQQDRDVDAQDDELGQAETYAEYMPSKLKIGLRHPDPVVETSSLATVIPPDITYRLNLPKKVVDNGLLSALQLEAVVYASQQHERILPDKKTRAGFLVGDGAGVGKGRTIAGIIYENWLLGRRKAVWLSVSTDLKFDSERDLKDIGAGDIPVYLLGKFIYGRRISSYDNGSVREGVIFSTYAGLISESQTISGPLKSRLGQLLQWLGADFDGCIIFDECHKAKNICPVGKGKPSKTAQYALDIQAKLPNARVVYASATGASEPRNLGYMTRLGIWGPGTPFKTFNDFCLSIERRGVGAMELVAVDLKMKGAYMARQLSFQGVTFTIEKVPLTQEYIDIYNQSVDLWVDAKIKFDRAIELFQPTPHEKKQIWTQFWSAHQRFFKYLCIGAKVPHVVEHTLEAVKEGKCAVIGLQSTGEAKTLEYIEECGDVNDFISTARAVFESLIEHYFPAPDRKTIAAPEEISIQSSDDDEEWESCKKRNQEKLAKDQELVSFIKGAQQVPSGRSMRARRRAGIKAQKKAKVMMEIVESTESSDTDTICSDSRSSKSSVFELSSKETDDRTETLSDSSSTTETESTDSSEDERGKRKRRNPFEARFRALKKEAKKKKNSRAIPKSRVVDDSDATDVSDSVTSPKSIHEHTDAKIEVGSHLPEVIVISPNEDSALPAKKDTEDEEDPREKLSRLADELEFMKNALVESIRKLGPKLPNNTLDELIEKLGGSARVAEMTGRKGRIVSATDGTVNYQCRNESDVSLEMLNIAEKNRFMDDEKQIAIISEAASSGISLHADRRVKNTRRRVHLTIELPWSADRAIQQFGRTHRSNQTSAPEYVFLISDLAGEQRFASIVAKRLESLGALTHGDRRATSESRDLSQFNIINKYGREALDTMLKAIMFRDYRSTYVPPNYPAGRDFFEDARHALVGAGLATMKNNFLSLEKEASNTTRFMNRLLGMRVEVQNALFAYFMTSMERAISMAKRMGRYDPGIMDLNDDHGKVKCGQPEVYYLKCSDSTVKCELLHLYVERGLSWSEVRALYDISNKSGDEGFYIVNNSAVGSTTIFLALREPTETTSRTKQIFRIYKPNTGLQPKVETFASINDRGKKVSFERAENLWSRIYEITDTQCSHICFFNSCRRISAGMKCDIGLRHRQYCILSGGVLTAWPYLERKAPNVTSRLQIVRLNVGGLRLIGPMIPLNLVDIVREYFKAGEKGVDF
ncbi:Protein strawberry notch-like 1, partial [Fragariocoptes setiger]